MTKGMEERKLVTEFLKDKQIDVVLSSPYKRSMDTVRDFAEKYGFEIITINDFCERKVDSCWIEDFGLFSKNQWNDFSYKLSDGECLQEVQDRNIAALQAVLRKYAGKNIVIGSHGTALSTSNIYCHMFQEAQARTSQAIAEALSFDKKKTQGGEKTVLPA